MSKDKAGKAYWDRAWGKHALPRAVNPRDTKLDTYVDRRIHEYLLHTFSSIDTQDKMILELGCARSAWLPYFAKEFGFKVYGIDYSETGCRQSLAVLSKSGVQGQLVCTDFFHPPEGMWDKFDVVVSFGVAEHFEDTSACIAAFARFVKTGGLLITMVPNLAGLVGAIQKTVNRPIFDIHVPLDETALRAAHQASGLQVMDCTYFLFANFGVNSLEGLPTHTTTYLIKRLMLAFLSRISLILWLIDGNTRLFAPNWFTSPYIMCLARKN